MRFAVEGQPSKSGVLLDLPRQEGLDLLEWLGLDRPEFGRIAVRAIAPLCRRRLWPIARNVDTARVVASAGGRSEPRPAGTLRASTERLLAALGDADGAVVFG
jgi:hypothetical protein